MKGVLDRTGPAGGGGALGGIGYIIFGKKLYLVFSFECLLLGNEFEKRAIDQSMI